MRYDLEQVIKSKLYKEFGRDNYYKGMSYEIYRKYILDMVKYVEENFRKEYEKLKNQTEK